MLIQTGGATRLAKGQVCVLRKFCRAAAAWTCGDAEGSSGADNICFYAHSIVFVLVT